MTANGTVLLVEDSPDDVALTLRAFEQQRITNEVVVARDGAQLCLGMNRQVSASRQILSQQPVGIFV